MINKFLYPNGGSETYIFKLGEQLQNDGHEVQYFGMEHEGRCVGNSAGAYTSDMDFHGGSKLSKLLYPFKTIYSIEARQKIRKVLDDFSPDVCHLNNFNYQLTPSIILEIVKWRRDNNKECRIIYTAHDYQLVCPNHMCNIPSSHQNCEKCLGGKYINCVKNSCIHGSKAKSIIGALESWYWHKRKVYRYFDIIICCSDFMKEKLDSDKVLSKKTVTLRNFVEKKAHIEENGNKQGEPYILYFGRYSWEKGVRTLIEACKKLPEIRFVFAGKGEYESEINALPNAENVGFLNGSKLDVLIQNAEFSICPSECYENCPFSVVESQALGTPVLGANIGGIPELIEEGVTGGLFESGNVDDLVSAIKGMNICETINKYRSGCRSLKRDTVSEYVEKLMGLYGNK